MTRTPRLASLLLAALLGLLTVALAAPEKAEAQNIKTKNKKKTKKKRRVKKKKQDPRGTGGFFRWNLGLGGCLDTTTRCSDDVESGFTPIDFTLGGRSENLAIGLHGRYQFLNYSSEFLERNSLDANKTESPAFWDISADLQFFPLTQGHLDPWVGLRLGFMGIYSPQFEKDEEEFDGGFGLGVLGGVDYFLGRNVALGVNAGWHSLYGVEERQSFWTFQGSLVFYWDVGPSSPSRSTPRSQPSTPEPAPVKTPTQPTKPKPRPRY